jgi:hypothetical protein
LKDARNLVKQDIVEHRALIYDKQVQFQNVIVGGEPAVFGDVVGNFRSRPFGETERQAPVKGRAPDEERGRTGHGRDGQVPFLSQSAGNFTDEEALSSARATCDADIQTVLHLFKDPLLSFVHYTSHAPRL